MSVKAKVITLIAVLIACIGMIVYGTILGENSISEIMPRLILMILSAVVVIIRVISNNPKQQSGSKKTNEAVEKIDMRVPDIDEIWRMQDKNNFVVAMFRYIGKKCSYDDNMENLNDEERVFYITQVLEMEVNNGGFAQFFFNSSGMFANELVASFEKIGAKKTAEICKKAISIYGDEVPTDRDKREEILTPDDEAEEERIEAVLNECDDAFFKYEDDLVELSYQFILNNKAAFSK